MECPRCLDRKVSANKRKKMKCIDTREWDLNVRYRRYLCKVCAYRESTEEKMKTTLKGE